MSELTVMALLQELERLRYAIDKDGTRHNAEHLGCIIRGFELVLNVQFYPTPEEAESLLSQTAKASENEIPF